MNDFASYIKILIFAVPAFCSVLCVTICLFRVWDSRNVVEKKFIPIAVIYFLVTAAGSFAMLFRIILEDAGMGLGVLIPLSVAYLYTPVIFYHLIHYLTHIGSEKPGVAVWHYILPLPVVLVILAIAVHIAPSSQDLADGLNSAGTFTRMFITYPIFRLGSAIYYSVPTVILVARALVKIASRRVPLKEVPKLLKTFLFVKVFTSLSAAIFSAGIICAIIDSCHGLNVPTLNIITAVLMTSANISLLCHIIRRRYDQFEIINIAPPEAVETSAGETAENPPKSPAAPRRRSGLLVRKTLEDYFYSQKPYLDPEFSLEDLAEAMNVKRTKMSSFINSEFNMNFKRYVNRWRLHEYQRLMSLPSNEQKNPYKILPMAGFTDPRHYRRVLQLEDEYEQPTAKKSTRKKAIKMEVEG